MSSTAKHPQADTSVNAAEQLQGILQQERELLLGRSSGDFQDITQKKLALVRELERSAPTQNALPKQLRKRLQLLQKFNKENGALMQVRLRYAQWAVDEAQGRGKGPGYGRNGSIVSARASRSLGEA